MRFFARSKISWDAALWRLYNVARPATIEAAPPRSGIYFIAAVVL
jgi:hypothetical protein